MHKVVPVAKGRKPRITRKNTEQEESLLVPCFSVAHLRYVETRSLTVAFPPEYAAALLICYGEPPATAGGPDLTAAPPAE